MTVVGFVNSPRPAEPELDFSESLTERQKADLYPNPVWFWSIDETASHQPLSHQEPSVSCEIGGGEGGDQETGSSRDFS